MLRCVCSVDAHTLGSQPPQLDKDLPKTPKTPSNKAKLSAAPGKKGAKPESVEPAETFGKKNTVMKKRGEEDESNTIGLSLKV